MPLPRKAGRTQVFEKDARAAGEGGEIEEPDREADWLAIPFGDLAIDARMLGKQRGGNSGFGRLDLMRQLLILGQLADEREDQSGVLRNSAADRERHPIAHTATSALMCGCGS